MIDSEEDPLFARVRALAEGIAARRDPRMRWTWGQALLSWSFVELGAELSGAGPEDPRAGAESDPLLAFSRAYADHWLERGPRIDQADTAAPALVTWALERRSGEGRWRPLTERVLAYLREGPPALGEALNHLGSSPEARLYPRSLWVDSLMMAGVFPARYAKDTGNRELLDRAARQVRLYASLLRDPASGLWSHSYWVRAARRHPARGLFWARGNGWVVRSLPLILDCLPEDHPEFPFILGLLRELSAALLPLQRPDGWFETILDEPGRSYRESSATALVAGGWMQALGRGWLGEEYREPALRAFRGLVEALEEGPGGELRMPEISAPTVPLPLLPRLGYALVPRAANLSYGVAALVLAALDYRRLQGRKKESP